MTRKWVKEGHKEHVAELKARQEDGQQFDFALQEYFLLVSLNQVVVPQQYFNHAPALSFCCYSTCVCQSHTHACAHAEETCEQLTLWNVLRLSD